LGRAARTRERHRHRGPDRIGREHHIAGRSREALEQFVSGHAVGGPHFQTWLKCKGGRAQSRKRQRSRGTGKAGSTRNHRKTPRKAAGEVKPRVGAVRWKAWGETGAPPGTANERPRATVHRAG